MNNELSAHTSAVPAELSWPELQGMSTQQLRTELAQTLTLSAQQLVRMAMIWRTLEQRGEDLHDLRLGLAQYLPLIAAGQLDAQTVVQFAGRPRMLRLLTAFPIDEQRRLALGSRVAVLALDDAGVYSSVNLPFPALTLQQASMVLDSGRFRSPDEQRALVERQRVQRSTRRVRPADRKVTYDSRVDLLRIGRVSVTVGEVIAALTEGGEAGRELGESIATVVVQLREDEGRLLKMRAAEAGIPMRDFARRVLVRFSAL